MLFTAMTTLSLRDSGRITGHAFDCSGPGKESKLSSVVQRKGCTSLTILRLRVYHRHSHLVRHRSTNVVHFMYGKLCENLKQGSQIGQETKPLVHLSW